MFFLPATQPLLGKDSVLIWRLLVWQVLEQKQKQNYTTLFQSFQCLFRKQEPRCYLMPQVPLATSLSVFLRDYLRALYQLGYLSFKDGYFFIKQRPKVYGNSQEREEAALKALANYNHISATPHKNMLS